MNTDNKKLTVIDTIATDHILSLDGNGEQVKLNDYNQLIISIMTLIYTEKYSMPDLPNVYGDVNGIIHKLNTDTVLSDYVRRINDTLSSVYGNINGGGTLISKVSIDIVPNELNPEEFDLMISIPSNNVHINIRQLFSSGPDVLNGIHFDTENIVISDMIDRIKN